MLPTLRRDVQDINAELHAALRQELPFNERCGQALTLLQRFLRSRPSFRQAVDQAVSGDVQVGASNVPFFSTPSQATHTSL